MSDGMTDSHRNGEAYRARLAREAKARLMGGRAWTREQPLLFDATEHEYYQRAGYTSHWQAAQELAVATAAEQLRQTTGMLERQLQRTREVEAELGRVTEVARQWQMAVWRRCPVDHPYDPTQPHAVLDGLLAAERRKMREIVGQQRRGHGDLRDHDHTRYFNAGVEVCLRAMEERA